MSDPLFDDRPLRPGLNVDLADYNRGFKAYLDYHLQRGTPPGDYMVFDSLPGSQQRDWIAFAPPNLVDITSVSDERHTYLCNRCGKVTTGDRRDTP